MSNENESKFLVVSDDWSKIASSKSEIQQAYMFKSLDLTSRLRIYDGIKAIETIKGKSVNLPDGSSTCPEEEWDIPLDSAKRLISALNLKVLKKTRYIVEVNGYKWEIDVYKGPLKGLVTAEIERREGLPFPPPVLPYWLGPNVSHVKEFKNANLVDLTETKLKELLNQYLPVSYDSPDMLL